MSSSRIRSTSVLSALVDDDDVATGAIEFYTSVFGATLIEKMDMAGGPLGTEIAHAELDFGDGRLQLSDPNPDYDSRRRSARRR
jgi:uncharacterized glyoxalase superfamily protein PhnB